MSYQNKKKVFSPRNKKGLKYQTQMCCNHAAIVRRGDDSGVSEMKFTWNPHTCSVPSHLYSRFLPSSFLWQHIKTALSIT